jgi:hypothetical protein
MMDELESSPDVGVCVGVWQCVCVRACAHVRMKSSDSHRDQLECALRFDTLTR